MMLVAILLDLMVQLVDVAVIVKDYVQKSVLVDVLANVSMDVLVLVLSHVVVLVETDVLMLVEIVGLLVYLLVKVTVKEIVIKNVWADVMELALILVIMK
jgi:hypothetical protein